MPLFGLRKTKKNEQSQIETSALDAKTAVKKNKKQSREVVATNDNTVAVATRTVAMPKGVFTTATESIIRPHITEKSGLLSQSGVYTFQVTKDANKHSVSKAIKALYKVTPIKIAIVNIHAKNVFVRGKKGSVPGMKKAIITLKKGEKIDFV